MAPLSFDALEGNTALVSDKGAYSLRPLFVCGDSIFVSVKKDTFARLGPSNRTSINGLWWDVIEGDLTFIDKLGYPRPSPPLSPVRSVKSNKAA